MTNHPAQIMQITEKNVDGCGGDAIEYIMFQKPIDKATAQAFEKTLRSVKNEYKNLDYDTIDFIQDAITLFTTKHPRIKAVITNRPFEYEITF